MVEDTGTWFLPVILILDECRITRYIYLPMSHILQNLFENKVRTL